MGFAIGGIAAPLPRKIWGYVGGYTGGAGNVTTKTLNISGIQNAAHISVLTSGNVNTFTYLIELVCSNGDATLLSGTYAPLKNYHFEFYIADNYCSYLANGAAATQIALNKTLDVVTGVKVTLTKNAGNPTLTIDEISVTQLDAGA